MSMFGYLILEDERVTLVVPKSSEHKVHVPPNNKLPEWTNSYPRVSLIIIVVNTREE